VELFEELRWEYEFGVGSVAGVARKFGVHRRLVREALGGAIPQERLSTRFRKFEALWIWQGPVDGPVSERGVHDVDQFGGGALEGEWLPLLAAVEG
jgi:hypothetical protein